MDRPIINREALKALTHIIAMIPADHQDILDVNAYASVIYAAINASDAMISRLEIIESSVKMALVDVDHAINNQQQGFTRYG